jgi:hypothetical protein
MVCGGCDGMSQFSFLPPIPISWRQAETPAKPQHTQVNTSSKLLLKLSAWFTEIGLSNGQQLTGKRCRGHPRAGHQNHKDLVQAVCEGPWWHNVVGAAALFDETLSRGCWPSKGSNRLTNPLADAANALQWLPLCTACAASAASARPSPPHHKTSSNSTATTGVTP